MIKLTGVWTRYLKYYKSMKNEFPDEPIWDRAIEDTEQLLRPSCQSPNNTRKVKQNE